MPTIAETIENAVQYHQGGHLQLAEKLYRMVLQNDPDNPVALHSLGVIAHQREKDDTAVELIGKAIANNPQIPQFHNTLGLVLEALGKFEEAVASYQQAVSIKPDYAEAYHNMAIALQSQGRYAAAVEKCKQVVSLKPDYAEAYNTMAFSLEQQERCVEAIENYRQAVRFKPDFAEAYNHLGVVLNTQGCPTEAIENHRRALQLDPDYAEAHLNLSFALLITGKFTEGWKEYEWRLNPELDIITYPHSYETPRWDGSCFTSKRLLVHYEQGLGDTLHYVRYLPMVKTRGGTVILEVRKPLYRLLQSFPGVDELIEASSDNKPAVKFDYHVSLMDLPKIFATTQETIPAEVPYIHACPTKAEYWRKKLASADFKVGIVWAGSPAYENNRYRSCTLKCFAPLTEIDGVRLYGLQKGEAAAQMDELAGTIPVTNISREFEDFTDTAAVIENLDLVISVDTSVLHLAGAMGKPVWALLSFVHSYRWMLNRQDSPWYPTMKLFRQKKLGQWQPVFQRVAEELRIMAAKSQKSEVGSWIPEIRSWNLSSILK
jgi:tetratricopeptide (TPR) repeat protein